MVVVVHGRSPCVFCGDYRAVDDVPIVPAALGGGDGATVPACATCRGDRSRLSPDRFAAALRRRGVDVAAIGPRLEAARLRKSTTN